MASLFISHSGMDNDKAVEVRDWLAKNGRDDIFLDLDPIRGIAASQRWKEALQKNAYRLEVGFWRSSRRRGLRRVGASRRSTPRVSWVRR
jgi:hypothetical protein